MAIDNTEQLKMELVTRDEILSRFEFTHKDLLRQARSAARQFGIEGHGERKYGIPYSCTADDVRELIDVPPGTCMNFMGSVFKEVTENKQRIWECCKSRRWNSETKGGHGNDLPIWILTREYLYLMGRI